MWLSYWCLIRRMKSWDSIGFTRLHWCTPMWEFTHGVHWAFYNGGVKICLNNVINLIIILMGRGTPLAALRPPHPALRQSRWEPQLMLAGGCGLGNQVRSPNHLIKLRVDIRFFPVKVEAQHMPFYGNFNFVLAFSCHFMHLFSCSTILLDTESGQAFPRASPISRTLRSSACIRFGSQPCTLHFSWWTRIKVKYDHVTNVMDL